MNKENKKNDYGYNSTFPTILRKLMEEKSVTQEVLAKHCGTQRQTIGQWKDGNTKPDITALKKIAEFFNVSTDYLLGITPNSTTDAELNAVCKYIGLSEKAVKKLRKIALWNKGNGYSDILSLFIEDRDFSKLLSFIKYMVFEDDQEDRIIPVAGTIIKFKSRIISEYAISRYIQNITNSIENKYNSQYKSRDEIQELLLNQQLYLRVLRLHENSELPDEEFKYIMSEYDKGNFNINVNDFAKYNDTKESDNFGDEI